MRFQNKTAIVTGSSGGIGARTYGIIREVHESKRQPGVDLLYMPGEIEANIASAYDEGIMLSRTTVEDIVTAGQLTGVDATPLLHEEP